MEKSLAYEPPAYEPPPYESPVYESGGGHSDMYSSRPPSLGCNVTYFRTLPAILKSTEIIVNIILLIISSAFNNNASVHGINFAATITLIFTIALLVIHATNTIYHLPGPWIFIELICVLGSSLLHFATFLLACIGVSYGNGFIACALFLFANGVIYGIESYLLIKVYRASGPRMLTVTYTATSTHVMVEGGGNPVGAHVH